MTEHIVTSFDDDLAELDGLIRWMGETASAMVARATRAIIEADEALAQQVIAEDGALDRRQRELDDKAITLIARRQPMAADLRVVVGAIRMAADLERIGDLAKNISKRVGAVGEAAAPRYYSHSIEAMAEMVLAQVAGVIERYEKHDAAGLGNLRVEDEAIDIRYTAIFRELLTYMMEDPRNITACTHLLFCAKNLERIGDHVTNIAENAYYVITGSQLPPDRPKRDETAPVPAE